MVFKYFISQSIYTWYGRTLSASMQSHISGINISVLFFYVICVKIQNSLNLKHNPTTISGSHRTAKEHALPMS